MARLKLEPRIGLEVHCQLTNLKTKLFCSCPADYRGKPPNSNVCPVCMGEPGALPLVNREAVKSVLKIALALKARISRFTYFSRKNYFYPDLPKNFQISQYDGAGGIPLAKGGYLDIGSRRVRIRRIQLEEDPGRIVYEGTITSSTGLLIDYNRSGVALAEIVTEPDLRSPREARVFLEKLRSILEYLKVFDGTLEGAMRCDANISLPDGGRVEVKNILSFKDVEKALSFEIARQRRRLDRGLKVVRETRHWDPNRRITVSLRVKEEEQDYRYFPEPDLPPLLITEEMIREAKQALPLLPDERISLYIEKYGLSRGVAEVIAARRSLADLFEETVKLYGNPSRVAEWLTGRFLSTLNRLGMEVDESKAKPEDLVWFLENLDRGFIERRVESKLLVELITKGSRPKIEAEPVKPRLPGRIVEELIVEVLRDNPKPFQDALRNRKALNYLVGLILKKSEGRVDAREVYKLLARKIREAKRVSQTL